MDSADNITLRSMLKSIKSNQYKPYVVAAKFDEADCTGDTFCLLHPPVSRSAHAEAPAPFP